jgi:hypothetical protein
MQGFSTNAAYVFEVKFPSVAKTTRHVEGLNAGKVTSLNFLTTLLGLFRASVPFVIRRRK